MNKDFIYILNNVINTLFMFCTYIYIFLLIVYNTLSRLQQKTIKNSYIELKIRKKKSNSSEQIHFIKYILIQSKLKLSSNFYSQNSVKMKTF